ncbi:MAG: TonB-dependent receptor [Chlorobi bacterium]|nr:MAG: Outer membrane receptor protein [Chlorobi bacterium OLB7]MBK8911290.1 TonB-dependent receptor [Chlorobiota bacterium]MBX7217860.1 TonB-dependent receptor [Candidatus Kapabacteria bacterium]
MHAFLSHVRFRCSFLALLLLPAVAAAQTTGTVTGIVTDGATGKPLKAATILLRDASDTTAKPIGDLTDGDGTFTIQQVAIGKPYTLEARYTGYAPYVLSPVTLTVEKPLLELATITLQPRTLQQDEVKVTAERPQVIVMADKTVHTVENNPNFTATNVSELLGQVPSIQVDQDGKIFLRGSENITIMMNDRPLTMPADQRNKFLQSLPASMVKDIEIRTNPGAKFDAKDQGGIINIVTRRTLSDMVGGNVNGGADTKGGLNGGAGLFYNSSTVNASLSGGGYYGPNTSSHTTLRINYLDSNERKIQGGGNSESSSSSYYGYGQIDYKLTESDLFSLSFNLNGWGSEYTSNGANTYFNASDAVVGRFFDTSFANSDDGNSGGYNSGSLLYKHTLAPDHTLELNVGYDGNGYKGNNRYVSRFFRTNGLLDSLRSTARNNESDRSNSTIISNIDYENPISESFKLTAGVKNELNFLDNNTVVETLNHTTGEFTRDTAQTNHYLPRNSIYALYGNGAVVLSEKFTMQAGFRVEHAIVSAKYESGEELISRSYTNLFPSGSLAWNMDQQNSLTFSYRRSVALPDIDALNPTKFRWNDLSEFSGNPDLQPEFSNNLELSYSTFWGMGNMVTFAPYYSTTSGTIESSQQLINGVNSSSYANFNGSYSVGADASVSVRPWEWLNVRASGNIYQQVNRGSAIPGDLYSSAIGNSGNLWLTATLMEGLTLSNSLYFRNPATVGGQKPSNMIFWNASLQQHLLDKKLTISLRLNDPLNLQKWQNTYSTPEFYTDTESKWESRSVGISISYNFGTIPRLESHQKEKSETKGSGGGGGNSGGGGGSGQGG